MRGGGKEKSPWEKHWDRDSDFSHALINIQKKSQNTKADDKML